MPERWRIRIEHDAIKMLQRLPRDLREGVRRTIDDLAEDPWPAGCKRLRGHVDLYRLRVGDWSIIYAVYDAELVVLVIDVAARSGAYRELS